jgi:hypothetical protein
MRLGVKWESSRAGVKQGKGKRERGRDFRFQISDFRFTNLTPGP